VQRWDIKEPLFEYNNLNVYLHYIVNDQNDPTNVKYTIFDGPGCQEAAHQIVVPQGDDGENDDEGADSKTHGSPFRSSEVTFEDSSLQTSSNSKNTAHVVVGVQIDPNHIVDSTIYHQKKSKGDVEQAQIVFCVRFSLFISSSSSSSIEVNFRETIVKLDVDSQGEFQLKLAEPMQTNF
jgi:hypothetical protein